MRKIFQCGRIVCRGSWCAGYLAVIDWLVVFLCFPPFLWANPQGGQVVGGAASFSGGEGTLTITTSDRAIINWQDFSIGLGELTRFIQPGSSSAVLNRVITGNPSSILGTLQANGQVYLINPNGILVGSGARIDCASFIASTLDVNNAEFMAGGDLKFVGNSTAGIQNLGTIQAREGDVFLIARHVENAGTIRAASGVVGLAAGQEVLLKSAGDERLVVKMDDAAAAPAGEGTGIQNSGAIEAVQAELKAHGNLYALAINHGGTVRATGAVKRDGRVILTGNGGTIQSGGVLAARKADGNGGKIVVDAGRSKRSGPPASALVSGKVDAAATVSGAKGGEIQLLGDRVGVLESAVVDVGGSAGGGAVYAGGNREGQGPLPNSTAVWMSPNAVIRADATESGDGGTVILFAENSTQVYGTISARGGPLAGNGGFIETSGKVGFEIAAVPDVAAPMGFGGAWLIDPNNIAIVAGGGNVNINGATPFVSTSDNAQLGVTLINTALSAGTSVTVSTGTGAPNTQAGDITMATGVNIAKTAGANCTLTMNAHNDINLSGNISSTTGTLGITLNADSDTSGVGSVIIGGTLGANGGAISLTGWASPTRAPSARLRARSPSRRIPSRWGPT